MVGSPAPLPLGTRRSAEIGERLSRTQQSENTWKLWKPLETGVETVAICVETVETLSFEQEYYVL